MIVWNRRSKEACQILSGVCMCMYVCMYICMYICMYMCMYVYM